MDQQWPATGTGALVAADLGGTATTKPMSRQPTNRRTVIPKKFLHCCKSSRNNNRFSRLRNWQRSENPKRIWRPVDLIIEYPQDWGNRLLEGKAKLVSTRTQEKGEVTPQEPESDLSISVQESPAKVWVYSGLPQGQGHWIQQSWEPQGVLAKNLLKEVAIITITPSIVGPHAKLQEGKTASPINRKLD